MKSQMYLWMKINDKSLQLTTWLFSFAIAAFFGDHVQCTWKNCFMQTLTTKYIHLNVCVRSPLSLSRFSFNYTKWEYMKQTVRVTKLIGLLIKESQAPVYARSIIALNLNEPLLFSLIMWAIKNKGLVNTSQSI